MSPQVLYAALVFVSGFAALLYELTWQRVLHAVFGTGSESFAAVAGAFMLGLGLGALLGGRWASRNPRRLLVAFAVCELSIAFFAALSIGLLGHPLALSSAPLTAILFSTAVLLPPTMCMGASLPLLATYAVRFDKLAAPAVARFYVANTLGASVGSLVCVTLLFGALGLRGTLLAAMAGNVVVALGAFALKRETAA